MTKESESNARVRRIEINSKYALCMDKYAMWLEEYRKTKSKKKELDDSEGWFRVAGYCGKFEDLMASFVINKTRCIEADDAEEFLAKMEKLQKETLSIIKKTARAIKLEV